MPAATAIYARVCLQIREQNAIIKEKREDTAFPCGSFVRHRRPEKQRSYKSPRRALSLQRILSHSAAIRRLAERAEKELLCLSCNTNAKNAEKNLKSLCRNLTIPSSAPIARRLPYATGAGKCFPLRGKIVKVQRKLQNLRRLPLKNRSKKAGYVPRFFLFTIAEPSIKDAITPLAPAFLKAAASVAGVAIFPSFCL